MAGNKKPRKPHRRRQGSAVGGLFAVQHRHDEAALSQPMTDDQVGDLALAFRLAFQAMVSGAADEQHWSTCVCSLNIALVLAEQGIGADWEPEFNAALEGAFRAKLRAGRTGSWGFDGPAMQAIKEAFELHELQIESATKGEIKAALIEVRRRIDAGDVYQEAA